MAQGKSTVLIIGTGGIGAMAAYALQTGGKAEVTAVLRSNYDIVMRDGFSLESMDHGHIKGFRIENIRRDIPNVIKEGLPGFDYILITTKNVPDVPPSIADLVAPAVTPGKTAIVLSQNGLNIERQFVTRFPTNPIISSVSYLSVLESPPGHIFQYRLDVQKIGAFASPQVQEQVADDAARSYINIYNASGKLDVTYEKDVALVRWRKLVYNASFNSVAAVLRMDTPRMRMSRHAIDDLVRPIMHEVMAAAAACGVHLPADFPEVVIRGDPVDTGFKPSMCQDVEKGNLMEIEHIVGEPLREGEERGVAMPVLRTVYGLLKGLQLQVKEAKGLWEAKFEADNPYQ